jgi:hypothetical protein
MAETKIPGRKKPTKPPSLTILTMANPESAALEVEAAAPASLADQIKEKLKKRSRNRNW